jgi:16S rRNA A1518/A1519 N6-dimethyltransferase RsmA/KsgA/DIM1 with predicted DNA glycosylase/AP lyase activity
MHVSSAAFVPRPRVTSMVFRWDRREPHRTRAVLEEAMRKLRAIFRRRKKRAERELVRMAPQALMNRLTSGPS